MAENESRLRRNLRKNIPPGGDEYEDAFQEAVLKVHSAISRGHEVKDFEKYFFIASFREYQRIVDPYRPKRRQPQPEDDPGELKEERFRLTLAALEEIEIIVAERFGAEQAALYLDYMRHKTEDERCSYEIYAKARGIGRRYVSVTVSGITEFLRKQKKMIIKWDG